MSRLPLFVCGLFITGLAHALSLADLTQSDASAGLKDALGQGARIAVEQLGQPGGFTNDPERRIELPGNLATAARAMKMMGMGAQLEQLEGSMNRAAEAAVPEAQALLLEAVKKMSVEDAKSILRDGEHAATAYLEQSSRAQLRERFLPIVRQATEQVGVARQYNAIASQASSLASLGKHASIEQYVTEEALDALFAEIAEQERQIRQDPTAAATSLARKVFEAL